jgi:hypothetical protein
MLAFALLFAPLLAGQGGGSVDGKVVNPNTGQPVPGVDIVLYTRQALHYETTTDVGGGFQFADVQPGNYEIRFEKEGYSIGRREPPQPYRIAAGQAAIHVRLEMSRRAALSGRVVDGEGKPVHAQVKLAEGGLAAAVNVLTSQPSTGSRLASSARTGPCDSTTALSMMFWSSRTFPGHS